MSGQVILRALLTAAGTLTAKVPAARIIADELPLNTPLPAISLMLISSVDRRPLSRGAVERVTERVQVSVFAKDATERRLLVGLVRAVAAGAIGDVGIWAAVSVQTDGQGPDMTTDAGIRIRSQDFTVSFNEPT